MNLNKLINYLELVLNNKNFQDYSLNGLQVENSGKIEKIYSAVDANAFTIEKCSFGSMLIVHHGIFWGKNFPLTGANYKKIKMLINNDVALYATHLPLDAHPEIGNNALLLKIINASITGEFGKYNAMNIGFAGEFPSALTINEISFKLKNALNCNPVVLNFSGKKEIKSVCAVSGDPGMQILEEFSQSDIDLLITGESSHVLYNYCEDNRLDVILATHYATETLGIRALGNMIAGEFLLKHEFIEHNTGQ